MFTGASVNMSSKQPVQKHHTWRYKVLEPQQKQQQQWWCVVYFMVLFWSCPYIFHWLFKGRDCNRVSSSHASNPRSPNTMTFSISSPLSLMFHSCCILSVPPPLLFLSSDFSQINWNQIIFNAMWLICDAQERCKGRRYRESRGREHAPPWPKPKQRSEDHISACIWVSICVFYSVCKYSCLREYVCLLLIISPLIVWKHLYDMK